MRWYSVVISEMRIVVWCCESCQGVSICLIYGDHIRSRSSSAQTLSQYVTALAQNNTRAGDTGALLSHSLRTNFCWFRNYFSFNVKIGYLLVNRTKSCWYSKYILFIYSKSKMVLYFVCFLCVSFGLIYYVLIVNCQCMEKEIFYVLCLVCGFISMISIDD